MRIVSVEDPLPPEVSATVMEEREAVTVGLEGAAETDRVMLLVKPRLLRVITELT